MADSQELTDPEDFWSQGGYIAEDVRLASLAKLDEAIAKASCNEGIYDARGFALGNCNQSADHDWPHRASAILYGLSGEEVDVDVEWTTD